MELSKITAGVIMVCVAVLVCAVVLVPVVDDVTATERTFKNEGSFYLQKYSASDEVTLFWDSANPGVFTINGENVTYTNSSGASQSVVLSDRFAIRLNNDNARMSYYGAGNFVNTSESAPTMTFTYSEGAISVSNGTTTRTMSDISEVYVISSDGPYTMKKTDAVAYLNSGSELIADSEIYASGITYNGNNNIFWHLEGTIENLEYPDVFNSTYTVSNKNINGDYAGGYTDLYELNSLEFTITTTNSIVYNITASYFVVPSEVTASVKDPMSSENSIILSLVPILMFVGVVLVTVRLMAGRSD